jgi:hypothetical protein
VHCVREIEEYGSGEAKGREGRKAFIKSQCVLIFIPYKLHIFKFLYMKKLKFSKFEQPG